MGNFTISAPGKGRFRCNACQQATPPKDGDWFESLNSAGQQIFLCKPCESKHKLTHKRVGSKA